MYPLIFIPAEESLVLQNEDGPVINPGDLLISGKLCLFTLKFQSTYFSFFSSKGSADSTARSWSFDTGGCLKIFKGHGGAVTTMATDAVGKMLFTAGNEFAFFDLIEIFPKMGGFFFI